MRIRRQLILAAVAAAALIAIAVSSATARNLRVNESNFELIWSEALGTPKTQFEWNIGIANLQCRLTLLGRFTENTITKETTRDQGTINHEENGGCSYTIKTETLPWGVRYRGFTGRLPTISSITISVSGIRFRVKEGTGMECEFGTEIFHPGVFMLGNSGEVTETGLERTGEPENITAERHNRIPLRGEFLCGLSGEAEFGGIGLVRNLPRNADLRFTLI